MEQKLNIAEILKNKPIGIKLYSPIFGDCTLCYIKNETNDICVKTLYDEIRFFDFEGRYNAGGECLLFPSKEMRDWSKFAWKRGDVLINNSGFKVLFDKWTNDVYTGFYAKIDRLGNSTYYDTNRYTLAPEDEAASYIKIIEDKYEGKLNRETLEIDKTQPEFTDGDIVVYGKSVAICRKFYKHTLCFYVSLNEMFGLLFDDEVESSEEYRFATEEEKRLLFNALVNEGKARDAEKKQIVDLKPKCKFKPFDKVLVRDWDKGKWGADFFSHYDESSDYPFICIKGVYKQCIPYNDMTRHLLCTTGEWKG